MYIIGTNDEPGNMLGPWTELGRAETEEAARTRARELAVEHDVHDDSGIVVMAWPEGAIPKWSCTIEEPDLQGGWTPTLTLPVEEVS